MLRQLPLFALVLLILTAGGCGAGGDVAGLVDPGPSEPTPPTAPPTAPPTQPEPPEPPPSPDPTTSMSEDELVMALSVLDLVNIERQSAGLEPLTWDDDAAEVAYSHSVDMDDRGYFDHTNPDGQEPWDRLSAAGVRWSTAGENIARGQPTPEAVVAAWMDSPGHRENILRSSFRKLGIGVHDNGSIWWTQLFYAP